MATYRAIAATGRAILRLLQDACPRGEFPRAEFELYTFNATSNQIEEGILLHLYRVALNVTRRNAAPTLGRDGQPRGLALPLDLYYVLIPCSGNPDMQQRLLGWAMRLLEDTPSLPSGVLNNPGPELDTFRPDETVELTFDPVALPDMSNIWDMLKPRAQLCVTYIARVVSLESNVEIPEGRPVQTREFAMLKAPLP